MLLSFINWFIELINININKIQQRFNLKMNILTNICNPKEEHFQQQAKTQTYKPLNQYVFQNRTMDKMRARYEGINNPQQFKYQSWNHPYSISNYFMHQNGGINPQNKQSVGGSQQYMNYQHNLTMRNDGINGNKKISFKQIPQSICGIEKDQDQGEKHFAKRSDFYASMRANGTMYGNSNFNTQDKNYHPYQDLGKNDSRLMENQIQAYNSRYQKAQKFQNQQASQSYQHSHTLLSREIIQLKQENKELKRVIQEEYKPMKQLYNKLLSQQQEREYLISKLEWKVKELVKQMGGTSGSFGFGQVMKMEKNHNYQTKRQNIGMTRVDSEKYFTQTPTKIQSYKPFETNFANIKSPQQNKPNNLINSPQKNYQNLNVGQNINQVDSTKFYSPINPFYSDPRQTNYSSQQQFNSYTPQQQPSYNQPNQHLSNTNLNQRYSQTNNLTSNNQNISQIYSKPVPNFQINHQTPTFQQQGSSNFNQQNGKFNF